MTRLLNRINRLVLNEKATGDRSKLSELVALKKQADAAMDSYSEALVKSNLQSDEDEAANMRQKREELAEIGPLFANFLAEAVKVLSSQTSSSCNGSIRSHVTETASRKIVAQAETDLARERRVANLQQKTLAKRQAIDSCCREEEQVEERLKQCIDSEMRMIEAEATVEKACAELDLEDLQVLSEVDDLAPVMSVKNKVRNFC